MQTITGFILYVDILGYKNLVFNMDSFSQEKTKKIFESFAERYAFLSFSLGYGQSFDSRKLLKRCFSDNFLFVYKSSKESILDLLILQGIASHIQTQFLYNGMLTRGSISYGSVDYSEDIVYGRDLVNAIMLEENHFEPSITIDNNLKALLEDNQVTYRKHNVPFDVHPDDKISLMDIRKGIEKYLRELSKLPCNDRPMGKIKWLIDQVNAYFLPTGYAFSISDNESIMLIVQKGGD